MLLKYSYMAISFKQQIGGVFIVGFLGVALLAPALAQSDMLSDMLKVETSPTPLWSVYVKDKMPEGAVHLLTLKDGVKVRIGVFEPKGTSKATLVLMAGYTEFIEKYFDVIADFIALDYTVIFPEWRGHGHSGGRLASHPMRLHVTDFDIYTDDLLQVMDWVNTLDVDVPIFALAHSMGGQIALRAVHDRPDIFKALALSAPMLDIPVGIFRLGFMKFQALLYIALGQGDVALPGVQKSRENRTREKNIVSNNQARFDLNEAIIQADYALNVEGRSLEWALRAVQAMEETRKPSYLAKIKMPIFFGVADDDKLVLSQATIEAAAQMKNASLRVYAPAQHELLMEVADIKNRFIADVSAHFERYMK